MRSPRSARRGRRHRLQLRTSDGCVWTCDLLLSGRQAPVTVDCDTFGRTGCKAVKPGCWRRVAGEEAGSFIRPQALDTAEHRSSLQPGVSPNPQEAGSMVKRVSLVLAATLVLATSPAHAGAPITWTSFQPISPTLSPYPPGCSGSTTGTLYPGTEVEPWIATNPRDNGNSIAVWQQDRYSNGGANSLRAAYSSNNQWRNPANQPAFTLCSGGTIPTVNAFERASDPWVTFASDGHVAYFMALAINQSRALDSAMTVSRSFDGGATWEQTPQVLKYDASFNVLNDKNSMTADRSDPMTAYAIWDRLVFPNERSKGRSFENAAAYYGPTWFTRTTNGGDSWEPARKIWDPGQEHHNSGRNDQSIGNQIVQTSSGDLVDVFDWINNDNGGGGKGYKVATISSADHGQTWSNATVVSRFIPGVVSDPTTGDPVRTGDIIPEVAHDPRAGSNTVHAVWQGASATSRSSIYLSTSTNGGKNWSTPA